MGHSLLWVTDCQWLNEKTQKVLLVVVCNADGVISNFIVVWYLGLLCEFIHFDDNDDDDNKEQRYLQVYDNHNSIMINHPN